MRRGIKGTNLPSKGWQRRQREWDPGSGDWAESERGKMLYIYTWRPFDRCDGARRWWQREKTTKYILILSFPHFFFKLFFEPPFPVLFYFFKTSSHHITTRIKKKDALLNGSFCHENSEKLIKILDHFKALWKYFYLAPIWYFYLFSFRNGIS